MGEWSQGRMRSIEGVRPKATSSHNQACGKGTMEAPQVTPGQQVAPLIPALSRNTSLSKSSMITASW